MISSGGEVIFHPLPVRGAFELSIQPHSDDRGFFARLWCRDEFAAHGIAADVLQANISFNKAAGTVRGMHFARLPATEGKLVRCQRGRAQDVIVDIRADSPSYLASASVELRADKHNAVWVPPGVAHGFQTLEPDTEIIYLMSDRYRPELADGYRFDDTAFAIRWPMPPSVIAERDLAYPPFSGRGISAAPVQPER